MSSCDFETGLFYSALACEPGLADLVALFVSELPARLEQISAAALAGDFETVGRIAHQLKGAGGSHGFPQMGPPALRLEQAARELKSPEAVTAALEELAAVCQRLRPGTVGQASHLPGPL